MAGKRSSSRSPSHSGSSGPSSSFAGATRRLLSFVLRVAGCGALSWLLWFPFRGLFIRALSAAAERVLAIVEHPPIVTALTARGDSVTLHSYVTGVPQALTQLNCADLHASVVIALALALAVPGRSGWDRARLCGVALALVSLVLVVVCVVQVEAAAEGQATTRLGLTLYSASERAVLDWALRKSSFATVFLVPSFLFFTAYVSTWFGAAQPERSVRPGWKSLAAAATGCVLAGLLLIPDDAGRAARVDVDGLRKIAALNPGNATAHLNLAFNLEKEGRHDEALASYRRALELQPDLIAARFGEGNVLFGQGAYDEAARRYQDVLERRPDDVMVRFDLGNALMKQGKFDLAREAYAEVLRSAPDDPAALRNLSQALIGLNRPCEALAPLTRSTALDPTMAADATLREQIGTLRSRCGTR